MLEESGYHFISAVFIFAAAIVPIYLSFKLTKSLRILTIVFAVFVVVHGLYHIFGSMNKTFLSEIVFEPLSAAVLVTFGIFYLKMLKKKEEAKR